MAQTRKRRRTKHRGNAAGIVESRGRTGRKPTGTERRSTARDEARARRQARFDRPPSWESATQRALISGLVFIGLLLLLFKRPLGTALLLGVIVAIFYIPLGYYTDKFVYNRRMAKRARGD